MPIVEEVKELVNLRLLIKQNTTEHGVTFIRWDRYTLTNLVKLQNLLTSDDSVDDVLILEMLSSVMNHLISDFLINNSEELITSTISTIVSEHNKNVEKDIDIAIANVDDLINECDNTDGIKAVAFVELFIITKSLGFDISELLDLAIEKTRKQLTQKGAK